MTWWGGNSIPDTRITEWPTTENCYIRDSFLIFFDECHSKSYLFLDKGHFITVNGTESCEKEADQDVLLAINLQKNRRTEKGKKAALEHIKLVIDMENI